MGPERMATLPTVSWPWEMPTPLAGLVPPAEVELEVDPGAVDEVLVLLAPPPQAVAMRARAAR